MGRDDYQTFPGRTSPCCQEMKWALTFGHIRKGYLYRKTNPPRWISWRFNSRVGAGVDCSPIHFCPFSGHDLDAREE